MKRIICLLLTVAMLLGCFAACGGDAGSSEPSKTESSKQETSSGGDESSEATEPEGGETGAKDPIEFSLFVDMTWFWFDKWGTEPVSQKITETTGVSFTPTVLEPHAKFEIVDWGDPQSVNSPYTGLESGATSKVFQLPERHGVDRKYTIRVTAQDGVTQKEYNITIRRAPPQQRRLAEGPDHRPHRKL